MKVSMADDDRLARRMVADLLASLGQELAGADGAPPERGRSEALRRLAAALDAKDPSTHGHARRVADLSVEIGRELGVAPEALPALEVGGLLHDLGKLGIPDRLLSKPEPLSDAERDALREHARLGEELLAEVELLRDALPAIRHHHERWDGQGYPDQLAAERIPLVARIVNAADTWDACVSDRPYQSALAPEEAAAVLARLRGRQIDPAVHDALLAVLRRRGLLATHRAS